MRARSVADEARLQWPGTSQAMTVLVFTIALVVAGGNAVAIRFSNRELDPLFGAAIRFALSAAVFIVIAAASRAAWPRGRGLAGALLYGVLNFGLAYGLIYEGLRGVHAGLAQVLLASVPLATLLLAAAHGLEAFRWRRLVGTVIAIGGIAVVSLGATGGPLLVSILSVALVLAAAVSIGEGAVVVKLFPPQPIASLNAVGMAVGTVLMAAASLLLGEKWTVPAQGSTLWAIGFLVVSTVIIFAAFLFVLRRWSALATSYMFLLVPIPAVILSSLLDGAAHAGAGPRGARGPRRRLLGHALEGRRTLWSARRRGPLTPAHLHNTTRKGPAMTHKSVHTMLDAFPKDLGGVDEHALAEAIDACVDCARVCTACADACLSEDMVADLARCIRTDLDCADVCAATGSVLSRQTARDATAVRALVEACRTVCGICAEECERHAEMHGHCRICAVACRRCEQACAELLGSVA